MTPPLPWFIRAWNFFILVILASLFDAVRVFAIPILLIVIAVLITILACSCEGEVGVKAGGDSTWGSTNHPQSAGGNFDGGIKIKIPGI
ncbi:MAG: hypothetical protein ACOYOU_01035 [Kiritimatiellia bacterium]